MSDTTEVAVEEANASLKPLLDRRSNRVLPLLADGPFEMLAPYDPERMAENQRSKVKVTFLKQLKWLIVPFAVLIPVSLNAIPSAWLTEHNAWGVYVFAMIFFIVANGRKHASMKTYPTHLQAGKEGLRLHWLSHNDYIDSEWVEWESIEYVSLVQEKNQQNLRFCMKDQTVLGRVKHLRHEKYIEIAPDAFLRDTDRASFLGTLCNFLSPEKLDPAVVQLQQAVPLEHTRVWLKEFSDSVARDQLDALPVGTVLADNSYEIVGRLGSGGQSVAYKAAVRDRSQIDADFVVLKEFVLPAEAGKEIAQRALRSIEHEVKLLRRLNDQHVVKCFDWFIAGHRAYIILEYIEGKSLKSMIENQTELPESQVIYLGIQLCRILQCLRSNDVIHRDLTPDNVLCRSDGTLVLIDFNVAQHAEATSTRELVGKHSFIPPEQFRGKATFQSDLYAAGCCMYFLCTGQDPEPLTCSHPRTVRASISETLDQIVAKATEQSLLDRFQSAEDMELSLNGASNIS